MSRIISRTKAGYTHNFTLDVANVVPEYFTGTFNAVVYAKGVTGQIDGSIPTAVTNGAYFICTRVGVQSGQVFQLGHIYLGVAGSWVDQGVKDGQRFVPTIALTGNDLSFFALVEYTYVENFSQRNYANVTFQNVPGVVSITTPYSGGKGTWRMSGESTATTPTAYFEAASSTMRYGVGNFRAQVTRPAGTATFFYTLASLDQIRTDPRVCAWTAVGGALSNGGAVDVASPVTAFKVVFSDTTPGNVTVSVN